MEEQIKKDFISNVEKLLKSKLKALLKTEVEHTEGLIKKRKFRKGCSGGCVKYVCFKNNCRKI